MKLAVRGLLALLALLALALLALAVLAPRLVDRPEVRDRIAAAAQEATGRTLRYERLAFGLLPPRLEARGVALEGGAGAAPLRAQSVALEVALLPLLARTVLIDTLVVNGAELTLVRTTGGIELPLEPPPKAKREPKADAGTGDEGGGLSIAVREIRVEDTRLTLLDRTVRPPQNWQLTDLDTVATGTLAEGTPVTFSLDAKLAGAPLHLEGQISLGGALDVKLALADFALAPLGPYLPAPLTLAGSADIEVHVKGDLEHFEGPLALELTDAEIVHGETFHKPAGDRAALAGRLVRDGEVLRIEEGQLALREVAVVLSAEAAPQPRAKLDAARFELSSFAGWLPGLAAAGVSGGVALEAVEVSFTPLSVRGGIALDGVNAPVGETRGSLSGRLQGQGDALVGEAMELRVAEQVFRLGLRVDSLATAPQASLRLASEGADAGALVGGLTGKASTLEGPLAFSTALHAPVSDPDALLRALSGQLQLGVTPGRLRGVSLLRGAMLALGSAGGLAERLSGGQSGKLERFYRDAFESLSGSFRIADGRARTDDLRLVYEHYQVDLAGVLGLLDRSLDFRGKLILFEDVDRALGDGSQGVKRELPLAGVKGTLDDPKVTVSPQVALSFAAAVYGSGERRQKLERKIEEQLGEGSGKAVLDLLDSVLGAGSKGKKEGQP
jgi:hypothetical protein